MKHLILHYPSQAYDKLEEISYLLKNSDTLKMEDYLKITDFRNYKQFCAGRSEYCAKMKYQFGGKKPAAEGEEEAEAEPEEVPAVGFVQDLLTDSKTMF